MAIFNSGLDWLTLTNVVDDETEIQPLTSVFRDLSGVNVKWNAGGYRGDTDPDTGVKYGSRLRRDGRADEILILPGKSSGLALDEITNITEYRATRLDIQVTVTLDDYDEDVANDLYDRMTELKGGDAKILRRRKVTLVKSSTGQTMYLGSRKSGRKFFRVYDKSYDLGSDKGTIWRQEIQYGRYLAQDALERYLPIAKDRYARIALICAEFQDALWWSLHDHIGDLPEVVSETEKPKPTLFAKLQWLETCVRPTISLMIEEDLEQEMLYAIGLKHHTSWERKQEEWKKQFKNN